VIFNYTKGVIFDLDGVVSDTQKIKTQVSVDLLYDKYGIEITPEDFEETYMGMKTRQIFSSIFKKYEIEDAVDDFIELRISELDAQIENHIPLVPGSIELIDSFKQAGYKLALATGGVREWSDKVAKRLNIKNKFDVFVYADEVEKIKPNPEIYILAAEKLRLDAKKCIVIEDSKAGVIAAKEAGMKCIALVENIEDHQSYPADVLVKDLRQIDVSMIHLVD
jgi:HAD superfamily hydrolase (TIGR01509 family)